MLLLTLCLSLALLYILFGSVVYVLKFIWLAYNNYLSSIKCIRNCPCTHTSTYNNNGIVMKSISPFFSSFILFSFLFIIISALKLVGFPLYYKIKLNKKDSFSSTQSDYLWEVETLSSSSFNKRRHISHYFVV